MPRIHTLDVSRLTPLGQLIAEYMRQQWPRMQTKAEFAHEVGVRPSTVDNLLYSQHAASTRTLNKIARATGIPATRLYEAAAGSYRPPTPPVPPVIETQRRPPRIAEQQSPYAALHEFLRSLQVQQIDEETRRALIDTFVEALQPAPGTNAAPSESPPPWDDHDAVSTLQIPIVPPPAHLPNASGETETSQQESQPAGSCR